MRTATATTTLSTTAGADVSALLCSEDVSGALAAEPPSDVIKFSISASETWLSAHTAIRPPTGKVSPSFASDAEIPELWDCPKCGAPAGQDKANPPSAQKNEPYKTHLAYVRERRSKEDGDAILAEAIAKVRGEVWEG